MKDIEYWRSEIDKVDSEIAKLFEKRMHIAEEIAKYKEANDMKVFDSSREDLVIAKNLVRVEHEKLKKYYKKFLIDVMNVSKEYQKEILNIGSEVAYQGEKGAFSYITMKKLFKDSEGKAYSTFEDVFSAVANGEARYGVLPVENSYTGEIGEVFDLLKRYDCNIVKTYNLKINQNLMGVKGSKIEDIEEVYSHAQGFLQSEKFLKGRGWKHIDYGNTAASAKYISEIKNPKKGAICSLETASLYDLEVLAENINTNNNNYTKFIVISKDEIESGDAFSLLITTEHKKGELARVIKTIEKHGYNMLNIKSRPIKDVPWEYYFYVELEGDIEGAKELLEELRNNSKFLKVLGSYTRGDENERFIG